MSRQLLLSFLCSAFSYCSMAQIVELELASDSWPPFTHVDESSAVASQLVREALNRNEVAVSTKIIPFNHVISGLKKGDYDGSAALWKNDERSEFLRFSDPYLQNQLVLATKSGGDVSMQHLNELPAGTKLGIVGSYSYGHDVSDLDQIELVSGVSDQENLSALLKGRVDYILIDDLLVHYLMQFQPGDLANHLEVGTTPLLTQSLYFAVRSNLDGGDKVMEDFNKAIKKYDCRWELSPHIETSLDQGRH